MCSFIQILNDNYDGSSEKKIYIEYLIKKTKKLYYLFLLKVIYLM